MASSAVLKRNPYIIGVPIHDSARFFGRDDLFAFIRDNLADGARVILLSGQRRIGKTSVLLQIPRRVDLPEFVFAGFDLQALTRSPLAEVLSELAERVIAAAKLDPARVTVPPEPALARDPHLFAEFLRSVLEALPEKKLALLLDEFDVLANGDGASSVGSFFPFLENILSKQDRLIAIPVVGRRLDEIPKLLSLFKGAPHAKIGLLEERSARRLIVEPAQGLLDYSAEAIQAIRRLTAGHPYFTQLLCHVIFQVAREEDAPAVSAAMVESAVREAMDAGEAGLTWFREGLPVPERVLFSAIAEAQEKESPYPYLSLLERHGVALTPSLRSADVVLRDWEFVRGDPPRVVVELVRRWLVSRHPVRRTIWELPPLDRAAQQLFEEALEARQAGDPARALSLFGAALEQNPNHFQALFEAAELCLQERAYERAAALYQRAYLVEPRRAQDSLIEALLGLARELLDHGEFAAAGKVLAPLGQLAAGNDRVRAYRAEAEAGARHALAVRNPFHAGGPTPSDMFVGRGKEVEQILSSALAGQSVAVFGELGMGKSSLLRRVLDPEVQKVHGMDPSLLTTTYLDCGELLPEISEERFWQRALRLDTAISAVEADEMIRGAASGPRRPPQRLLLMDDLDAIFEPALQGLPEAVSILLHLRALIESRGLSAVVSSRQGRAREPFQGASWWNIFRPIHLSAFRDDDIRALAAKAPEPFAPDAAELAWVAHATGGYPCLTQFALSVLFQRNASKEPFEAGAATREMVPYVESLCQAVWEKAAEAERDVLALISLANFAVRAGAAAGEAKQIYEAMSEAKGHLRDLEARGLAKRCRVGWALTSPLIEWWIVRSIEDLPEEQLLQTAERISRWVERGARNRFSDIVFDAWSRKLAEKEVELWARPAVLEA